MQQVAVRWQSKTFRGNLACRAGTTVGLARESLVYMVKTKRTQYTYSNSCTRG